MSNASSPSRFEHLTIEMQDGTGGVCIMGLSGPLTLRTLFDFQEAARAESRPVIVDLHNVPYMDSAGLGSVIGLFVSCQRHNRGFGIVGLSDRIRTLFQVTHVDGMLPCFESVEAARAAIAGAA
jgi:anti-sigma B factor antagonist